MADLKPESAPGSGAPSSARAFELLGGSEHIVFLAADERGLPGDGVRRELRVLARQSSDETSRSVIGAVLTDGISGIIGGAAYAGLAATCTATVAYLRGRNDLPAVTDAATVIKRLKMACVEIYGSAPREFSALAVQRLDDGRWNVQFRYEGTAVRALLDPGCSIILWTLI